VVVAVALAAAAVVVALAAARDTTPGGPDGLAGAPVEQFMHVHGLAIAPWAPDDVYLSTHLGLIRISPDGRWRYVSEEPHDFMGFAVHPQAEGVHYTSGHPSIGSGLQNPLGFMVSTDAGRTWEVRSMHDEVDFHAMAVDHIDGEVIYGFDVYGGRLLRSSDAGHTWDHRALPHPQGALSLAVHPTDPDTVLAGTPSGLVVSRDAGRTWGAVLDGQTVTAVAVGPAIPERIVIYAPGEGLLESLDASRSWRPLGPDLGEDAVTHIALHPTDADIVYVGTLQEAIYRTLDGGTTWEQLAEGGVPVEATR
jgi:hypothetical protein